MRAYNLCFSPLLCGLEHAAGAAKLASTHRFALLASAALISAGLSAGLSGCAVSSSAPAAIQVEASLAGSVHGGQQPVSGALVSLIAPGTGGYGSVGTLITSTTTNAAGGFTLPRPYTCPANSGLVYLLATGGNAGAGTNAAIAEAAIVGSCSALSASTFVNISEVTTVAAAYALAPFATISPGVTGIGTSAGNLQGLYNAAGPANNLANIATGLAHATGDLPGIVPPTSELNTLADILSSCVNQGTTSALTGTCATLFGAATPSGGATPTDTFQAAINIAKAPGRNVNTLFGLVTASPPFQPALASAPNDFSVALGFNGGALTLGGGNLGVAIDALGDAWIVTGQVNPNVHSLTEISPAGTYISGAAVTNSAGFDYATLSYPVGIAIDQSGYVWVTNNGAGNLQKFNSDGTPRATITANSFLGPNALAFDPTGDAWVVNFGNAGGGISNVTEINTTGVEASGSPFAAGQQGVDIAVSPTAVWQTNSQGNYVYRIDLTTHATQNQQIGGSIGDVAIDHANNAWLAVTGNGSIFEISDSLSYVNTPYGGYQVAGTRPQNIAVDGLGNVFAGALTDGTSPGSLLEYSNSAVLLSPGTGFTGSNTIPAVPGVPGGIAIDGSGNIWITGGPNGGSAPIFVSEIVGIAAPVVTPRAVATTNNTLGTRP